VAAVAAVDADAGVPAVTTVTHSSAALATAARRERARRKRTNQAVGREEASGIHLPRILAIRAPPGQPDRQVRDETGTPGAAAAGREPSGHRTVIPHLEPGCG